tara:strand:- start:1314 stop:1529 length:216 start_codon:yes stop_codon:yes gene_type:complete
MNKSTLQEIADRLESTVRSSNPNQRYSQLMNLVGELKNAINQPEDVVEVVEEKKPIKKKKSSKKKKTSTED